MKLGYFQCELAPDVFGHRVNITVAKWCYLDETYDDDTDHMTAEIYGKYHKSSHTKGFRSTKFLGAFGASFENIFPRSQV